MKKTYLLIFGFAISSTISPCFGRTEQKTKQLIDPQATVETIALYQKLDEWAENHIVFGHQSATEYGHGWTGDKDRSDVKSVTGSHPGIVGLDFSGISGRSKKDVRAAKAELEETIIRTHAEGSLITMVWHFRNPVTPETGFYWKEDTSAAAVQQLVPGGSHHSQYQKILNLTIRLKEFAIV
jgi:mannan endo-1,4-beta-mannosidase